jgi:hypothetical protein
MQMVQDVVSIAWPTIDATWRYSIFEFGALVMHAPRHLWGHRTATCGWDAH